MRRANATAQVEESRVAKDMVQTSVPPSWDTIDGEMPQVHIGQDIMEQAHLISPVSRKVDLLIQVSKQNAWQAPSDRMPQIELKVMTCKLEVVQGAARVRQVGHNHGNRSLEKGEPDLDHKV